LSRRLLGQRVYYVDRWTALLADWLA